MQNLEPNQTTRKTINFILFQISQSHIFIQTSILLEIGPSTIKADQKNNKNQARFIKIVK